MSKLSLGLALVMSVIGGIIVAWLSGLGPWGYLTTIAVTFLLVVVLSPISQFIWQWLLDNVD